jgi:hypothetical protein
LPWSRDLFVVTGLPLFAAEIKSGRARKEVLHGESRARWIVDALEKCGYIHRMPVKKVQVGQVWKKDDSGDSFLITKIYTEALATFAVLRKTGAEGEPPVRIKITQAGAMANLPGFTYTQQSDDF